MAFNFEIRFGSFTMTAAAPLVEAQSLQASQGQPKQELAARMDAAAPSRLAVILAV
jgi:hypothetical protein